MILGPAGPADLDALAALSSRASPDSWTAASFAEELDRAGSGVELARLPGGPVVAYLVWRRAADELEILALAVAPEWRRRRIAEALLRRTLAAAGAGPGATGSSVVHLELRASNGAARSLYAALGFVVSGRRPRYYRDGEDALLMSLTLHP